MASADPVGPIAPRRVLMIAFHYPPLQGGSGVLRTESFARYLPQSGWQPLVLSARSLGHGHETSTAQTTGPAHEPAIMVRRSITLDAARHLAVRGRYPACLALPDRWSSWCLSAVPAGLGLIRRYRPAAIWSTYPIASAHLIALALQRLSGLPWIADQRDPMLDDSDPAQPYPPDAHRHRLHAWIEQRIAARCAALVCTTPGAVQAHRARLARLDPARICLIENGHDEADFGADTTEPRARSRFLLLHSGVIYPSERDPRRLFAALARLREQGAIDRHNFQLRLRATGHDGWLDALLRQYGIADLVTLAPLQPHAAALQEMQAADGLLLLQAANCNAQIPAKLYEYLRCRRPILALADAAGDTAARLRGCGVDTIGQLADSDDCARALLHFLALARAGRAPLADRATIALQSRQQRSSALAQLLDAVTRGHVRPPTGET